LFEVRRRLSELCEEGVGNEALRHALLERLAELENGDTLLKRIEPILKRADEIGEVDPNFDLKACLNEMWGEL